jgi:hypothetical protein
MYIRNSGLCAAAITILLPVVCGASPEKEALNACARAFASSLASPGAAPPSFKLVYGGEAYSAGSVNDFYSRAYTFDLHARDQKSGMPIARASCSTNARGGVVALSAVPL